MFDTIIVGAGISGLSAGQYLMNNGNDNFLVLESAEKIGGRVETTEFGGKLFSIGPGWLHGRKGNPIYDIVKDLGIQIEECQNGTDGIFVWDVKEKKDITDVFIEKSSRFEEMFQDVSHKVSDIILAPEKSVLDVLCDYYDILRNQNDLDKVVIFLNKEIYMGASLNQVSGRVDFQLNKVYKSEGDEVNFRIIDPLGITKVIKFLSMTFENKICLGTKVTRIIWSTENHESTVITDDGREFRCKNVIITLQSEMLANEAIIFEPKIPTEKILAWRHIPSVDYCRVFAKFPYKFWPAKEWLVYVPEDVQPFDDLIAWKNCQKQNLCSAEENILICHCTFALNDGSRRFDVNKNDLTKYVTESMQKMFPETYCQPDDVMMVSHRHREGFSGAFCIPACGIDDNMIRDLKESIGPLHFAGESVSVELLGTMQSAYITGQEAASRTIN